MTNICIGNLIGLPAAGKSTFCKQFLLAANQTNVGVIHICFDDFITVHNESPTLQRDRFQMRCFIRAIVRGLQQNGTAVDFTQLVAETFQQATSGGQVWTNQRFGNADRFFLLIDDNMYYRSMRKQIRHIAAELQIGYFHIYFNATVTDCLSRNRERSETHRIPDEFLRKMNVKFEPPTGSEAFLVHWTNASVAEAIIEKIVTEVMPQQMRAVAVQRTTVPSTVVSAEHQSKIHRIDIVLRKEVNRQIKLIENRHQRQSAAHYLCQRRVELLSEIRCHQVDIDAVESLDDWKTFVRI